MNKKYNFTAFYFFIFLYFIFLCYYFINFIFIYGKNINTIPQLKVNSFINIFLEETNSNKKEKNIKQITSQNKFFFNPYKVKNNKKNNHFVWSSDNESNFEFDPNYFIQPEKKVFEKKETKLGIVSENKRLAYNAPLLNKYNKPELKTVLKEKYLGKLDNNLAETIKEIIIRFNSNLNNKNIQIYSIEDQKALVYLPDDYSGVVEVNFELKPELKTVLKEKYLGKLDNNSETSIRKAIFKLNPDLNNKNIKIYSIEDQKALVYLPDDYSGVVEVNFELKPELKTVLKEKYLGKLDNNLAETIKEIIIRFNSNLNNKNIQIYSIEDQKALVYLPDDYSGVVEVNFELKPELKTVLKEKYLGKLDNNSETSIRKAIFKLNPDLNNKNIQIYSIEDQKALVYLPDDYSGVVEVNFELKPELKTVLKEKYLGKLDNNLAETIKEIIIRFNSNLNNKNIQIYSIEDQKALVYLPDDYSGVVEVNFELKPELKTVLKEKYLGKLDNNSETSIRKAIFKLNPDLNNKNIQIYSIEDQKALVYLPDDYSGVVEVNFELKPELKTVLKEKYLGKLDNNLAETIKEIIIRFNSNLNNKNIQIYSIEDQKALVYLPDDYSGVVEVNFELKPELKTVLKEKYLGKLDNNSETSIRKAIFKLNPDLNNKNIQIYSIEDQKALVYLPDDYSGVVEVNFELKPELKTVLKEKYLGKLDNNLAETIKEIIIRFNSNLNNKNIQIYSIEDQKALVYLPDDYSGVVEVNFELKPELKTVLKEKYLGKLDNNSETSIRKAIFKLNPDLNNKNIKIYSIEDQKALVSFLDEYINSVEVSFKLKPELKTVLKEKYLGKLDNNSETSIRKAIFKLNPDLNNKNIKIYSIEDQKALVSFLDEYINSVEVSFKLKPELKTVLKEKYLGKLDNNSETSIRKAIFKLNPDLNNKNIKIYSIEDQKALVSFLDEYINSVEVSFKLKPELKTVLKEKYLGKLDNNSETSIRKAIFKLNPDLNNKNIKIYSIEDQKALVSFLDEYINSVEVSFKLKPELKTVLKEKYLGKLDNNSETSIRKAIFKLNPDLNNKNIKIYSIEDQKALVSFLDEYINSVEVSFKLKPELKTVLKEKYLGKLDNNLAETIKEIIIRFNSDLNNKNIKIYSIEDQKALVSFLDEYINSVEVSFKLKPELKTVLKEKYLGKLDNNSETSIRKAIFKLNPDLNNKNIKIYSIEDQKALVSFLDEYINSVEVSFKLKPELKTVLKEKYLGKLDNNSETSIRKAIFKLNPDLNNKNIKIYSIEDQKALVSFLDEYINSVEVSFKLKPELKTVLKEKYLGKLDNNSETSIRKAIFKLNPDLNNKNIKIYSIEDQKALVSFLDEYINSVEVSFKLKPELKTVLKEKYLGKLDNNLVETIKEIIIRFNSDLNNKNIKIYSIEDQKALVSFLDEYINSVEVSFKLKPELKTVLKEKYLGKLDNNSETSIRKAIFKLNPDLNNKNIKIYSIEDQKALVSFLDEYINSVEVSFKLKPELKTVLKEKYLGKLDNNSETSIRKAIFKLNPDLNNKNIKIYSIEDQKALVSFLDEYINSVEVSFKLKPELKTVLKEKYLGKLDNNSETSIRKAIFKLNPDLNNKNIKIYSIEDQKALVSFLDEYINSVEVSFKLKPELKTVLKEKYLGKLDNNSETSIRKAIFKLNPDLNNKNIKIYSIEDQKALVSFLDEYINSVEVSFKLKPELKTVLKEKYLGKLDNNSETSIRKAIFKLNPDLNNKNIKIYSIEDQKALVSFLDEYINSVEVSFKLKPELKTVLKEKYLGKLDNNSETSIRKAIFKLNPDLNNKNIKIYSIEDQKALVSFLDEYINSVEVSFKLKPELKTVLKEKYLGKLDNNSETSIRKAIFKLNPDLNNKNIQIYSIEDQKALVYLPDDYSGVVEVNFELKPELKTVLKEKYLGKLDNNLAETIKEIIIRFNSNLNNKNIQIYSIEDQKALVYLPDDYSGVVEVNFELKPELKTVLKEKYLGKLDNNSETSIRKAIFKLNPDLNNKNIKIYSIEDQKALVSFLDEYINSVEVSFKLKPELKTVLKEKYLGKLDNNSETSIRKAIFKLNPDLNNKNIKIYSIEDQKALVSFLDEYINSVEVSFKLKPELKTVLKEKYLGKLDNNSETSIRKAIFKLNPDLNNKNIKIYSIEDQKALVSFLDEYINSVEVSFKLKPELKTVLKEKYLGKLDNNSETSIRKAIFKLNPDLNNKNIKIYSIEDQKALVSFLDEYINSVEVSFKLKPELKTVLKEKYLGKLDNNSETSIRKAIFKLNPDLNNKNIKIYSIEDQKALVSFLDEYINSVEVSFKLKPELKTVLKEKYLGKLDNNSETSIRKAIFKLNPDLNNKNIQIYSIEDQKALVYLPDDYSGVVEVNFELKPELKTVLKEKYLGKLDNNLAETIKEIIIRFNSNLNNKNIQIYSIEDQKALVYLPDDYSGVVEVNFELKPELKTVLKEKYLGKLDNNSETSIRKAIFKLNPDLNNKNIKIYSIEDQKALVSFLDEFKGKTLVSFELYKEKKLNNQNSFIYYWLIFLLIATFVLFSITLVSFIKK
ncbi:hypothetical protein LFWB_1760 [Candidatus Phytoplasma luffae]|uniref:ELK domain-containing protein n=1 Tax=Loofah witches'-broom phytoplasma TaxID=35773 RepID=A0A975FKR2_LOWBP|nr:hypothetical protein [Candidatus Phytoplasma luffae]QTX02746.1 hypothetical protein LFWB_1760 [Candidatus Phytoplasma luffae]